jgi:acetyl esterase
LYRWLRCLRGANLAAVVILEMPDLLRAQILVVPFIDNIVTPSSEHWLKNKHAPGLSPQKMYSFIALEFPNPKDRQQWQASPNRAPKEIFKDSRVPKAYIKVAGVDVLYEDGVKYAEFLKQNGVEVDLKEYDGVPHQVFTMAGALTKGREMLKDIIKNLRGVFK